MGAFLIILSALGFSTLGVFGKYASQAGFSRNQTLLWRFAFALPVMGLILYFSKKRPLSARSFMRSVLLGVIGIGVEASLYFITLEHLGASLTGVYLYLYPAFIALISHFALKQKLSLPLIICVVLSLTGSVLASGLGSASTGLLFPDPWGVVYGLLTAIWYAIYLLVGNRVMEGEDPLVVSFGVILGAFGAFLALSFYEVEQGVLFQVPSDFASFYPLLGLAVIASVIPFSALYLGMKKIGPLATSVLSTLEIVFTVLLARIFLAESLSQLQWLGALLILISAVFTGYFQKKCKLPPQRADFKSSVPN